MTDLWVQTTSHHQPVFALIYICKISRYLLPQETGITLGKICCSRASILVHPYTSLTLIPLHSAWLRWQPENTSLCACQPIVRDRSYVSLKHTLRHMEKRVQQPATITSKQSYSLPLCLPQAAAAPFVASCYPDNVICSIYFLCTVLKEKNMPRTYSLVHISGSGRTRAVPLVVLHLPSSCCLG